MAYIFYDTETTGTNDRYDQVLQFAAIHLDDELRELSALNLRCRIKPYVVPSPTAMMITRVTPDDLHAAPLSHYEMMTEIRRWIQARSPATIIGHNSINFDEGFLRQGFYKTLHPLYLTNTNGNRRADTMRMAQATHIMAPGILQVPVNERGNPAFKLGLLASANGIAFDEDAAHDALFDVRATVQLAQLIMARAPLIWRQMLANGAKADANAILQNERVCIAADVNFGRAAYHVVTACTPMRGNDASWAVFDLTQDPVPYLALDEDGIRGGLKAKGVRPIRVMRTNNQPMLFPAQAGPHILQATGLPLDIMMQRAALIQNDAGFRQRVLSALDGFYEEGEPAEHVEERIYDGFPPRSDELIRQRFESFTWSERALACDAFTDQRMCELAHRLIFCESPEHLTQERRVRFARQFAERALTEDPAVAWNTIAKSRDEIEQLRGNAGMSAVDAQRLSAIEAYLATLEARFRGWQGGNL